MDLNKSITIKTKEKLHNFLDNSIKSKHDIINDDSFINIEPPITQLGTASLENKLSTVIEKPT